MEWNEKGRKIVDFLKLRTPPVGVRFYEEKYEPERAFKPSKYGIQMAVCQAIAFARYIGRTVLLEAEDFACPPAMLLYGVAKYEGSLKDILLAAEWIKDEKCEVAERSLPISKYRSFVFGDLTKMREEPQAVLVFGTPAQIGRLIQAATYFGGSVKANLTAKTASCAEALFPALNGELAIAVPGAGDRVFAAIQETEMIFAMPYDWTDRIIEGLENAGRGANISYPPTPFLMFTPRFPKHYREIAEKFKPV
ncbi:MULTISPECIES: DUF169 domain-containing protein [unclassified Archaeoglobus]|jgi:uncharacterized protein (DUF169 family)|uniref:DUF169 domain-containing protein n=1 Tax=unclassified Archaeoglobus TaxID=2643606 RepID=UPI0025BACAD7|nr:MULTISPECIES: DUF169 domain-containing protein [unclassified Archaeoglobus]